LRSAAGRTASIQRKANTHDALREDRLEHRRGRASGRLRDRTELHAPVRGRAADVSGPGGRGSRVVRRRALVGGISGSQPAGVDPAGPEPELRRGDRRRPRAGGPCEPQHCSIGPLSVVRLQWQRVEGQDLTGRLQIARNSTDAYQRTYDLFLDRFNLGVASKLETSRAQGALGDAQANIPQLESDIVAKENQISVLLGAVPGPIPRGKPMYEQPIVPTVPAGLPSTLLQRRPDLRQAEQQLVSANARIGVAKAEFFPKLSLTALLGTASPEVSALTGGTATIWAVAGMFSGPLFNAGRTLGTYRASIA